MRITKMLLITLVKEDPKEAGTSALIGWKLSEGGGGGEKVILSQSVFTTIPGTRYSCRYR